MDARRAAGTHLAVVVLVILERLALTELWSAAIDAHDQRPLTRSAALAAHAVEHEDRRRSDLGIPSIFALAPLVLVRRAGR